MNFIYSDKELIYKLSKNDRKAYKYIYTEYYNSLFVYLLSFTKDDYTAEDIAQNVLMMLWEKRTKLNIHTSLKSYLYKSAYNAFIDSYKSKQKINKKLEAIKYEGLNKLINNNDDSYLKEQLSLLEKAIESLPPQCKKVLLLGKVEGYKYKEIAEELKISIRTVENHMSNAFRLLRKKMISKDTFILFLNILPKNIQRKLFS